jgi:hypothetical protein
VTLDALAVVPAAPLLLPGVSPAQPDDLAPAVTALRADVAAALAGLPTDLRAAVVLACGDELLVHAAARATLRSYGRPREDVALRLDRPLLAAVGDRGQAPTIQEDDLHGDLAVLALLLAAARPEVAVVPVTVPTLASRGVLDALAAGLVGAAAAVDGSVALVAAGDLAATLDTSSPRYLVEGAADFDAAAVAALRAVDEDAFAALGPAEAGRVQARGWGPLTVALAAAQLAGLSFAEVRYHAPRGVGQVVGRPAS